MEDSQQSILWTEERGGETMKKFIRGSIASAAPNKRVQRSANAKFS
jgi:hypothetical protein